MSVSLDLRRRAVESYLSGEGNQEEVSRRFKVGLSSLKRWVKLYHETGGLEPQTKNNRRPLKLSEHAQAVLRQLLHNSRDAHDQELADALFEATGESIDRSTVNQYWHRWGYTRKKSRLCPPSKTPTASTPGEMPTATRSKPSTPTT